MNTTTIPKEVWDEIFKPLTFLEIETNIHPINDHLFKIYGNIFHGLPANIWERVFENLQQRDLRVGVIQTCSVFKPIVTNTKSTVLKKALFEDIKDTPTWEFLSLTVKFSGVESMAIQGRKSRKLRLAIAGLN
ncbi:hypothetical protein TWF718_003482 [Orbilia javanica]|uniref:F-box domain-containing protein n=1 Tax=Orbilia javanica TaxID=47235 RepID=A0AAN8NKS9_9PEZI